MQTQAGTLNVHSRCLHEAILDYAERLTDLHAEALTRAVFCCTGTEASEIALLMARATTGGRGIISSDGCTTATVHALCTPLKIMEKYSESIPYPPGSPT